MCVWDPRTPSVTGATWCSKGNFGVMGRPELGRGTRDDSNKTADYTAADAAGGGQGSASCNTDCTSSRRCTSSSDRDPCVGQDTPGNGTPKTQRPESRFVSRRLNMPSV
jgi:hypothetical protein